MEFIMELIVEGIAKWRRRWRGRRRGVEATKGAEVSVVCLMRRPGRMGPSWFEGKLRLNPMGGTWFSKFGHPRPFAVMFATSTCVGRRALASDEIEEATSRYWKTKVRGDMVGFKFDLGDGKWVELAVHTYDVQALAAVKWLPAATEVR